jgi:hypothetical protein
LDFVVTAITAGNVLDAGLSTRFAFEDIRRLLKELCLPLADLARLQPQYPRSAPSRPHYHRTIASVDLNAGNSVPSEAGQPHMTALFQ